MEFEWDLEKEQLNIQKHGCTFSEALESFKDPNGVQLVDTKHSPREKRYYWVGRSSGGRILTTRFTLRGKQIRIIGCAEWREMRKLYEKTQAK